jgi:hypothetical protein
MEGHQGWGVVRDDRHCPQAEGLPEARVGILYPEASHDGLHPVFDRRR